MVLAICLAFWIDARYRRSTGGRSGIFWGLSLTAAIGGYFLASYRAEWLSETQYYFLVGVIALFAFLDTYIGRVAKIYLAVSFAGSIVAVSIGFSWMAALGFPLFVFAFFLGAKVSRELENEKTGGR